jgi:asparagine synthase (glutamine-hydrolysing)
MCGIAGILKLDPRAGVDEQRLAAMRDSLAHRGPDGAGSVVRGPVGLAHRRLSIIDLEGGRQPMSNRDGTVWLTYNGELYNFRELRKELEARGHRFRTASDTEVVLEAWQAFGEGCVDRLRGMFAFALWDADRQCLFLARDRLGIKPLYFSAVAGELLFASEIKAILAGSRSRPAFNRAVLPEFLASRYVAGSETFFEGIHKLLPGHTLCWTARAGLHGRHYWQPPTPRPDAAAFEGAGSGRPYRDVVAAVRAGLEDAVQSHLVSDVPLGLFLSGGIDSTVLAALMARRLDAPLRTFSVGFDEAEADESGYARLAAGAVGAQHHEVRMTPQRFFAELPRLVWHEDEPIAFTSSVPLHVVSRLARRHVKVVLTGEGADELFLGYDYRYRITEQNLRWGSRFRRVVPAGLRRPLAAAVPGLPRRLRRYAERSFLSLRCDPRDMFFENFAVFRQRHREALLADADLERDRDLHGCGLQHYAAGRNDALASMSHTDLQTYLVELLMKQDQMSMAASLESRVPFLDHLLVEQVASIPGRLRLQHGRTKALLRDVVADLVPPAILNRRKMGFPVPVGPWLRGPFWPVVEEFVLGHRSRARGHFDATALQAMAQEHRTGRCDHAERLWLLINFEIWQRIFIDGEAPADVHRGGPRPAAHESGDHAAGAAAFPQWKRDIGRVRM